MCKCNTSMSPSSDLPVLVCLNVLHNVYVIVRSDIIVILHNVYNWMIMIILHNVHMIVIYDLSWYWGLKGTFTPVLLCKALSTPENGSSVNRLGLAEFKSASVLSLRSSTLTRGTFQHNGGSELKLSHSGTKTCGSTGGQPMHVPLMQLKRLAHVRALIIISAMRMWSQTVSHVMQTCLYKLQLYERESIFQSLVRLKDAERVVQL